MPSSNQQGTPRDGPGRRSLGVAHLSEFGEAKGDGVADDTAVFERAVASGRSLVVPGSPSHYRLSRTLYLRNSIVGEGMPCLARRPGEGDGKGTILAVHGYQGPGLTIAGLRLNGGWTVANEAGQRPKGEHDHGISIGASTHVTVERCRIEDVQGDSVFVANVTPRDSVGGRAVWAVPAHITIRDNVLIDPLRCCVAVVSGRDVRIVDNRMTKASRYVAAIDIEPDDGQHRAQNIRVERNTYEGRDKFLNTVVREALDVRILDLAVLGNHTVTPAIHYHFRHAEGLRFEGNTMRGAAEWPGASALPTLIVVDHGGPLRMVGNFDYTTNGASPRNGWNLVGLSGGTIAENVFDSGRDIRALGALIAGCHESRVVHNEFVGTVASFPYGTTRVDGGAWLTGKAAESTGLDLSDNRRRIIDADRQGPTPTPERR